MPKSSEIDTTAAATVAVPAAPRAPAAAVAETAPRRPKTSAAKAKSDAWYAQEADKAIARERVAREREQPYLEALGRVAAMQNASIPRTTTPWTTASGSVGLGIVLGQMAGVLPKPRSLSAWPMTIPAAERPVPTGAAPSQRAPMVVRPTQAPTPLTSEELETQTPRQLAQRAMETGKQFSDAIGAYRQAQGKTEAGVQSPDVARSQYPVLAAEQRKRLEAVLNLAAQMREYGFVGSNAELIGQFEPK
jgi:hypothetical protein